MPEEDDRFDRIERKIDTNGKAIRALSGIMGEMHMEMRQTIAAVYNRARKDERVAHGMPEEPRRRGLRLVPVALVIIGLGALATWALFGRPPQTQRVAGPSVTITTPGPTVTTTTATRRRPRQTPGPASSPPRSSATTQEPGLNTGQPADETQRPAARTPARDDRSPQQRTVTRAKTSEPEPTASAEPPEDPEPTCALKVGVVGLIRVCV